MFLVVVGAMKDGIVGVVGGASCGCGFRGDEEAEEDESEDESTLCMASTRPSLVPSRHSVVPTVSLRISPF